jgi:hypothetical protein
LTIRRSATPKADKEDLAQTVGATISSLCS